MLFKTKGDLLEYLGKKRTDNKLIDRMILRGEVSKWVGWYEYTDIRVAEINMLKWRIKELEEKLKESEQQGKIPYSEQGKIPYQQVWTSASEDLLDHLALMYTYVEQKNEFINKVVKSYYEKFSWQYDWEWAVDKVYKMYQYTPDVAEKEEIDYVKSLVTQ